ncbi:hypothetical protein SAMN05421796_108149 [Chryseobacterium piscicola]|uniref:Uncharacterized protein n=1 Tax=Chryseobacterium piscicola TaxID=551459 RepID=A0A1N7NM41_9FLAO|nr:hypothetical protein SAMN05421796_108149 [Chryseobacterium piscicola]
MENLIKPLRIIALITMLLFLVVKFFIVNALLGKVFFIISVSCFALLLILFCSKLINKYYVK